MKYAAPAVLALLAFGCTHTCDSDVEAVKKTVVTMVNAIDTKQWQKALSQFEDTVFVDYSSMTNQPGSDTKASDLVGGWEKLLATVDTHHMLTNFEISVDGQSAETFSHVYASHTAKGIPYWDIYGRYHHKLKKTPKGWRITSMKLLVHGQKGNLKFLEQVSKAPQK